LASAVHVAQLPGADVPWRRPVEPQAFVRFPTGLALPEAKAA